MGWLILGLLVYGLIGYALLDWAIGWNSGAVGSYPGEFVLIVVLWPFCVKGLFHMRFLRMMMRGQVEALEKWAKEQDKSKLR